MRDRRVWLGIGLGVLAAACTTRNEPLTIHLVDDSPAPPDTLAGLHLHVTDEQVSTANGPLDVDLGWPTSVVTKDGTSALLRVTQGCGGPDGICDIALSTNGFGCDDLTSYPGGCLGFDEGLSTVEGTFVHPTGLRCHVNEGSFDVTLRATGGRVVDQAFSESDVAVGTFSVPCSDTAGTVRLLLEGTFQLAVARDALLL